MMYRIVAITFILISFNGFLIAQPKGAHNFQQTALAPRWDEGMPLGNGWIGALIWQKGNALRFSLDRVDLWDDRKMPLIDKVTYSWVQEKVALKQYDSVHKYGDDPYEANPAPTKIPGAALEMDLQVLGTVTSNTLDISNGLNRITFSNKMVMHNYVHATKNTGYISLENIPTELQKKEWVEKWLPCLIPPAYANGNTGTGNSVEGQGLVQLGYKAGTVERLTNSIRYHQPTYGSDFYEVLVEWTPLRNGKWIAAWTIAWNSKAALTPIDQSKKEPTFWPEHAAWWKNYWSRSAITIPDTLIEKQYYREMYKFGCVARSNTPPISLQAIWTADNGNLPPWKGDFHHDLNTQLSYWPGYTGNHLDLTAGYTNWLWKVKDENKRWTKQCFGIDGLNVPGVTTISGKAMGGWVQYSLSPTTVAWITQHFYWQYMYSGDTRFLRERVLPYFKEVDTYFSGLLKPIHGSGDTLSIPISSSPEYNDNRITAWFKSITNYDLALIRNFYKQAAELSFLTGDKSYIDYTNRYQKLPAYNVNETGLTIAKGQNLDESHRHHAQLMAIYPFDELHISDPADSVIIKNSLRWLEKKGTRQWCGYSFSWTANLYARALEAENAAEQLRIFANNFVSTNSFHLNGDQKGGQYSSFTYRPFTLEGNFAFAQGLHEMLLQSYGGVIRIFPATPAGWSNISFQSLIAEGGTLVSARKENNKVVSIELTATNDRTVYVMLPFTGYKVNGIASEKIMESDDGGLILDMKKGQKVLIQPANPK